MIDRLRVGAIVLLGMIGLPLYFWLVAPNLDHDHALGWLLAGLTAIYGASVALVWRAPVAQEPGARRAELIALLAVALAWRLVAFASTPHFSFDAYRYTWDAHLLLHGISPYTHTPIDPALAGLRDAVVWPILSWRTVPTLYPPGAQALFVLVGIVAPLNIWALKTAILICDLLAMGLTFLLARRMSIDPRRAILYWWSPIPILEFAANAHVDALVIVWILLALWLAQGSAMRGQRALAGAALGMATLTKLYPLLFVFALGKQRDRAFFVTLGGVVALGYLVFLPLGIGSGGFLGTYFSQRFVDQGILEYYLGLWLIDGAHLPSGALNLMEGILILAGCVAIALWLRRGNDAQDYRTPMGLLAISIIWIVLSPHVFPWYVAALLPLFVLLPWGRADVAGASAAPQFWPAITWGVWSFTLLMPFSYVIFSPGLHLPPALFQGIFLVPIAIGLIILAVEWRKVARHQIVRAQAHTH